jgi:putative endonuclease
VYLVRTVDGAYYCGYSPDVVARVRAHNLGKGSKILRGRRPVRLAYTRRFRTKNAALRFEAQLKRRSHAFKHALSQRWLAAHSQR